MNARWRVRGTEKRLVETTGVSSSTETLTTDVSASIPSSLFQTLSEIKIKAGNINDPEGLEMQTLKACIIAFSFLRNSKEGNNHTLPSIGN